MISHFIHPTPPPHTPTPRPPRSHLWIEDDSRATDWASLCLPVPEYSDMPSSISASDSGSGSAASKPPPTLGEASQATNRDRAGERGGPLSFLSRSILRPGTAAAIVSEAKRRRANLDRQVTQALTLT